MESLQDFVSDTKILDPIFRVSQKSDLILTLDIEINNRKVQFNAAKHPRKKRKMRDKVEVKVC